MTSLIQTNQVAPRVMGQHHLYSQITILFLTAISLTHTQCCGHHLLPVNDIGAGPGQLGLLLNDLSGKCVLYKLLSYESARYISITVSF